MHPSLFFHPGALLSQPELSSARIDGLLIEVGEGYMPPDVPEDAAARIASLGPILIPGHAASGPTAAWVHGVGDAAPRCHHLQRHSQRRARISPGRNVVVHEAQLSADDIQLVAGTAVTTRLRTMTDLVLGAHRDAETAMWMRRFGRAEPHLLVAVRERLERRHRLPGKRAALAAVDDLLLTCSVQAPSQDEVTR